MLPSNRAPLRHHKATSPEAKSNPLLTLTSPVTPCPWFCPVAKRQTWLAAAAAARRRGHRLDCFTAIVRWEMQPLTMIYARMLQARCRIDLHTTQARRSTNWTFLFRTSTKRNARAGGGSAQVVYWRSSSRAVHRSVWINGGELHPAGCACV
jgi:hypothetical protein